MVATGHFDSRSVPSHRSNPFGVEYVYACSYPGCAARPWAGGSNPFGVDILLRPTHDSFLRHGLHESKGCRRGTTLVEVLVSIFVMAIGLVALLALFPLGAFEMADAIKDDHVSACVVNATALATAWDLRHDGRVASNSTAGGFTYGAFDLPSANLNVNVSQFNPSPNPLTNAAWVVGPSYPVYVDPVGNASYLSVKYRNWVVGLDPASHPGAGGIKRVAPAYAPNGLGALQWFTWADDINFDKNGTPINPLGQGVSPPGPGTVQRTYAYSWAYLLRRPKNSVPSIVEMWVVVYQQRPLTMNSGGDETYYNVAPTWISSGLVNSPKNVITLVEPPQGIPLRPGSWILDCSPGPPVQGQGGLLSSPGNARFYRVVGITDNGGTMDVEVDSPIIGPVPTLGLIPPGHVAPWVVGDALVVPSRFAVLEGVIEVVYKGTNWLPQ